MDGSGNGVGSRISSVGPVLYNGTAPQSVSFAEGNGWTPNITATWSAASEPTAQWDSFHWADSNGDRGDVLQLHGSSPTFPLLVTFTPDAGLAVLINSFDLDEHQGSSVHDTVIDWEISDGTGVLASGTWDDKNDANDPNQQGGRTTINTGLTAADVTIGNAVTLSIAQTSGSPFWTALDNLNFDQIPEPTSFALAALGLGGLIVRRRRK